MNNSVYCEEAGDLTGLDGDDEAATLIAPPIKENVKIYSTEDDHIDYLLNDAITNAEDKERFFKLWSEFKTLLDRTLGEFDNMYEDYKYDHDNYDSLDRERKMREMKARLHYLEETMQEILEPYDGWFSELYQYSCLMFHY